MWDTELSLVTYGHLFLYIFNLLEIMEALFANHYASESLPQASAELYPTANFDPEKVVIGLHNDTAFKSIPTLLSSGTLEGFQGLCINGLWFAYPAPNFQTAPGLKLTLISGQNHCFNDTQSINIQSLVALGDPFTIQTNSISFFPEPMFAEQPTVFSDSELSPKLPYRNFRIASVVITGEAEWFITTGVDGRFCFKPQPTTSFGNNTICVNKAVPNATYFGSNINILTIQEGCEDRILENVTLTDCFSFKDNGADGRGREIPM